MTPGQARVLAAFVVLQDYHRVPPTMPEVGALLGCTRPWVHECMQALVAGGYLERSPTRKARGYKLTEKSRAWFAHGCTEVPVVGARRRA